MMHAKIVGLGTTLIDVGDAKHPDRKIEGAWTVQIEVVGLSPGITRDDIMNAYRDGIVFEVTPMTLDVVVAGPVTA